MPGSRKAGDGDAESRQRHGDKAEDKQKQFHRISHGWEYEHFWAVSREFPQLPVFLSRHRFSQGKVPGRKPEAVLLRPGDSIRIELKQPAEQSPNYTSIYTVNKEGTFRVPFLEQPVQAAGLTPKQLARLLEKNYTEAGVLKDPVFAVETHYNGNGGGGLPLVVVRGAVLSGGREVLVRDGMRLSAAVIAAGGFDEAADFSRVKLTRSRKETIYDLSQIKTDGSNNPLLKDGDSVFVPKSKAPKPKPNR